MAQKIINVSDLSGDVLGENDTTLVWGFDGKTLEIDLTSAEQEKFHKAVARYIEASRPAKAKATSSTSARKPGGVPQVTGTPLDDLRGAARTRELEAIRTWATERDLPVNKRGRMATDIIVSYYAAQDQA